jgi:bifunctional UDP-N-acetylglucosamine pyrophosphorylase/glucosamine-1-phosphate N-acetyltransferase
MRRSEVESNAKLAVVIMAAGKGTRLKSNRPKVLHEIGGKPLLAHVITAASKVVAPGDIYVVIGHQAERVRAAVAATGVRFVEQKEQFGTGHAIQCCREAVAGYDSILVLPGDAPLIRPETIEQLWQFHQAQQAAMTILTVAQKDLLPEQQDVPEICVFKTVPLFAHLGKLTADKVSKELHLTDMAALLRSAGERVATIQADNASEVLGANTIAEVVALDATLRAATANRLMAAGVTIFRPDTCVIDADVEVAPDTVIEPYVQLLGPTRIGADCLIRSYSVIENCTLGNKVILQQSCILQDSTVEDGATIGPFAHLRPGSVICEKAHVGNFVETKKAKLGKGAKAGHLTYLGDAEIGENTNIGAGVITCNYDGVHKHSTHIGKNVFVGSDSTLVAPVNVADRAFIGAGSCITRDIPADALAVARSRQVVKEGWAAARKKMLE